MTTRSPRQSARSARGARGIKLHPRAEQFTLDHPGLQPVFALANERHLPVLVHAGRGIPALGRHSVDATGRHPGMRLILAHAGISDLAWIWRETPDHPNLFFDTSWWSPSDVQALFALVAPGQILMASDAPYGSPTWATVMSARNALQVGLDAEQTRGVLGGQALRLVNGEEPLDLGPAPGVEKLSRDPLLDRVYSFLMSALGQMFQGVEPAETLALVRLACDVGDDAPQASGLPLGSGAARPARALLTRGRRKAGSIRAGAPLRGGRDRHRPNAGCSGARVSPGHGRVAALERAIRSRTADLWGTLRGDGWPFCLLGHLAQRFKLTAQSEPLEGS